MGGTVVVGRVAHSRKGVQTVRKAEQRQIALGAVRSQLCRMGISIDPFVPFLEVLKVLDDLNRAEPDLIASQWYAQASENQIRLLRRDWKQAVQPVYEHTLWGTIPQEGQVTPISRRRK